MKLKVDLSKSGIPPEFMDISGKRAKGIVNELFSGKGDMTGWVNWPNKITETYINDINDKAAQIRNKCDLFVVIGIGGSYAGAKAVLDAKGGSRKGFPEICFAGNNLNGTCQGRIIKKLQEKETCICVISKSGTTLETAIAYEIFKAEMIRKYGEAETAGRIVIITDEKHGPLREEADKKGYLNFSIPENIGGRFSVLTAAGLVPLAVAGIDIGTMIKGARTMASKKFWQTKGLQYGLARYTLLNMNKEMEIFEFYNPSLFQLGEWVKQLFGESEGKQGSGLFPVSLMMPADLHSFGQYLQEGKQIFFETVFMVEHCQEDIVIPDSIGGELGGKTLHNIARCTAKGVIEAHNKAQIPIIQVVLEDLSEESLGQLLYFMEMTAAITGKLMMIDPFTQDGVEQYKREVARYIRCSG